MQKILILSFTFALLATSCSNDKCGECEVWTECVRNHGGSFGFESDGYICKDINRVYTGQYEGSQVITDSNGGSTVKERDEMRAQSTYDNLLLSINSWDEPIEELDCVFIEPGSGAFNIPRQLVYNTDLEADVYYEGSGSFFRSQSNTYSFELNYSYEYGENNYQVHINGAGN